MYMGRGTNDEWRRDNTEVKEDDTEEGEGIGLIRMVSIAG